jgi:hypothetical protein
MQSHMSKQPNAGKESMHNTYRSSRLCKEK